MARTHTHTTTAPGALARLRQVLSHGGALPADEFRRRHRIITLLLWAQIALLVPFGMIQGFTLSASMVAVAPSAIFACGASWPGFRNRRLLAVFAALGLLTCSAALVVLWHGTTEAHFHFFVMLAVVALYEDWAPYAVATGFVLLHHGVLGMAAPQHVFEHNGHQGDAWAWAGIHTLFVAAASAATLATWVHLAAARGKAEEHARAQGAARRVAEAVADAPGGPGVFFGLVAAEAAAVLGAREVAITRNGRGGAEVVGSYPPDLVPTGERPIVRVPIPVASHPWGDITVVRANPAGLSADAEEHLADLARLVGLAIANAEARRDLETLATTDALTSLANHRAFHDQMHTEVARAHRQQRQLALATFDIDHFKAVNDTYGHPVGDEVLAEVARRLREQIRPGDLLARVGGEEFAWLMPDTDRMEAWEAAERARRSIGATPFGIVGNLTLSAGTADLAQAPAASELVELSDRALYSAKRHGRDVTFVYSSALLAAAGSPIAP